MGKFLIFVLLICLVLETKVRRRIKVHIVFYFNLLQAQKGKKKKEAELESMIECYTCGLETEDPELDQVSWDQIQIILMGEVLRCSRLVAMGPECTARTRPPSTRCTTRAATWWTGGRARTSPSPSSCQSSARRVSARRLTWSSCPSPATTWKWWDLNGTLRATDIYWLLA